MNKLNVAIIIKNDDSEREYPFLGVSKDGSIVLFSGKGKGTSLSFARTPGPPLIGSHSDSWIMSQYIPLIGSITLTQT